MMQTTNADIISLKEEHYTPYELAEAAYEVMEFIDLDPASCVEANKVIHAYKFFTKEDNGLSKEWHGRVFLNPPGRKLRKGDLELEWAEEHDIECRSCSSIWWKKLLMEYEAGRVRQAIYIAFNPKQLAINQEMFQYPMCFTTSKATSSCVNNQGRIKFLSIKPNIKDLVTIEQIQKILGVKDVIAAEILDAIEDDSWDTVDGLLSRLSLDDKKKKTLRTKFIKKVAFPDDLEVLIEQEEPTQQNVIVYLPPKDDYRWHVIRFKTVFRKFGMTGELH